jgi:tight adherence protein B
MNDIVLMVMAVSAAVVGWIATQLILKLVRGRREHLQERLSTQRPTETPANYRSIVLPRKDEWAAGKAIVVGRFRKALMQAWPEMTPARFVSIVVIIFLCVFTIGSYLTRSMMIGVLGGGLAACVPFAVMQAKRGKRVKAIDDQLPDALDFLTRILRAGHSLATGLQMAGEELPVPLGPEFARCYAQHSLGQPLEDALKDMAGHVDVADFSFVATAVLIQRQTGGDLAEVLKNISGMVRARIRLQQHVKAITAEGRMVGGILLALPFVFYFILYLINPGYASQLTSTPEGRYLLAGGLFMQFLGWVTIRKIVSVKL